MIIAPKSGTGQQSYLGCRSADIPHDFPHQRSQNMSVLQWVFRYHKYGKAHDAISIQPSENSSEIDRFLTASMK